MMRILLRYALTLVLFGNMSTAIAADDPLDTTGHFKIEKPTDLNSNDATDVYKSIIEQMAQGYAGSNDPSAINYRKWHRFNTVPYLSAGHGNRFLNNYGNAKARNYLDMKSGGKMAVGAVLAKDSFTATQEGELFGGALFIMEKVAAGKLPEHGDWRYAMIMPDGSVFGDSLGEAPQSMDFCHACHKRVRRLDYLFLIPKKYRRQP